MILAAAREVFAERGYDNTTIRAVAATAGVDPALVHHYFGPKQQLFAAAVQAPVQAEDILPELLRDGSDDHLGERVVGTVLKLWEHPASGPSLRAMLRSAVTTNLSAKLLREFFAVHIVRRLVPDLGLRVDPAEIPLRASLVASQLFGLALARYVLAIEPLASTPRDQVVSAVAPTVQRYLAGPLPG